VTTKQANKRMSPYQRYDKAPTLYSAEYRAWNDAIKRGRDVERARANHDAVLHRLRGPAFKARNDY